MVKRLLGILVLMILFSVICSCSNKTAVSQSAIPFFYLTMPINDQTAKAYPGYWDIDNGTAKFSLDPIFIVTSTGSWDYNYTWDGNKDILLLASDPSIFAFPNSAYNCVALKTDEPGSMLKYQPDLNTTILSGRTYIEIRHGSEIKKIEVSKILPKGIEIDRAIDLSAINGQIEVTLECNDLTGSYLYLVRYSNESLTYKKLTGNLGIIEADSGTQMLRLGNIVYIGEQSADIKEVNLNTGVITKSSELNNIIANFKKDYVKYTAYESSPTLFYNNGYLFLEWFPAVIDSPQGDRKYNVGLLAALKDDKIQGMIKIYKDKAMIIKGDITSEVIKLPDNMLPSIELPR